MPGLESSPGSVRRGVRRALAIGAVVCLAGTISAGAQPTSASSAAAARHVGSPVFSDIDAIMDRGLARADARIAEILAIRPASRNYENTVRALDELIADLDAETNMAQFMAFVSTDADERTASEAAQQRYNEWAIDLSKNEALYEAVSAVAARPDANENVRWTSGEEASRHLEHVMRDFRRAGMSLPAQQRAALADLEKSLSELEIQFQRNIQEDESVVTVTRDELDGCQDDFIAGLERSGDLYIVTLDQPTVIPIWRDCTNERTRERVRFAYSRRGGVKNVRLLERIIAMRAERAGMLGYPSTADFQIETRMARTSDTVREFYQKLTPIVRRKAELDYRELLEAKRADTGDPSAIVNVWDSRYYADRVLREKYDVNGEEVKQYFPLQAVIDGLFGITQSLYGLEYRDVTASAGTPDRPLWHEDVRLFEVYDRETGRMMGEFYIDLHPRQGKYTHAAQWGLIQHRVRPDGWVQTPLAALVCNFTKPTPDKPSLMSHDEVETFFHEFGHCLHTMLSETRLASFGGTNVERDFVEAPSQMFENWVWDADVLRTFARHYQTGEPIPAALVGRMIAARHHQSGLNALGQLWLGSLDLAYHSDPDGEVDTTQIQMDLYRDIMLYPAQNGTYFQAAFGHLMGYHAGYYGYMWSLVYASDMFQRFKELGMTSPAAGAYYREKILSRGGSTDGMDMVRDYLGREPNLEAFLVHLGLSDE